MKILFSFLIVITGPAIGWFFEKQGIKQPSFFYILGFMVAFFAALLLK